MVVLLVVYVYCVVCWGGIGDCGNVIVMVDL